MPAINTVSRTDGRSMNRRYSTFQYQWMYTHKGCTQWMYSTVIDIVEPSCCRHQLPHDEFTSFRPILRRQLPITNQFMCLLTKFAKIHAIHPLCDLYTICEFKTFAGDRYENNAVHLELVSAKQSQTDKSIEKQSRFNT